VGHAAASRVVRLVHEGQVEMLMKGSLHTDEVLAAVISRNSGIRTERRISHIFAMDVPTCPKLLLVTDVAVNVLQVSAKRPTSSRMQSISPTHRASINPWLPSCRPWNRKRSYGRFAVVSRPTTE